MKKPFVVGERVSVSGWVNNAANKPNFWRNRKCILLDSAKTVNTIDAVVVRVDEPCHPDGVYTSWTAHQNQLRHLKPRRVRREFWIISCKINTQHLRVNSTDGFFTNCDGCEIMRVREVREKGKK